MSDPNYTRTTRRKVEKRAFRMHEPIEDVMFDRAGQKYLRANDGALIRVRKKEEVEK
jgi:hypothetical protein